MFFRRYQRRWSMRNTYWLQFSDAVLELYRISTTKPEVVITMRRHEIELQFRLLHICFRGRQSQWNIDRHRVLYSSAWILPIWKHGDLETGSSFYHASERHRNAISVSRYVFEDAKVNGTSTDVEFCIVLHELSISGSMATSKPEIVFTMRRNEIEVRFRRLDICFRGRQTQWNIDRHQVSYSSAWILPTSGFDVAMLLDKENSYRIWCRSMFHWLWCPRKPISRRRNCISISFRRIVITTSGFEVAMLPDRENSCRTIQNSMSVDVPLTLASSKTYI